MEEERLVDTGARRAQGGTFIHLVSARGGNWRTAAAVDGMEDGSGRRRHNTAREECCNKINTAREQSCCPTLRQHNNAARRCSLASACGKGRAPAKA